MLPVGLALNSSVELVVPVGTPHVGHLWIERGCMTNGHVREQTHLPHLSSEQTKEKSPNESRKQMAKVIGWVLGKENDDD